MSRPQVRNLPLTRTSKSPGTHNVDPHTIPFIYPIHVSRVEKYYAAEELIKRGRTDPRMLGYSGILRDTLGTEKVS